MSSRLQREFGKGDYCSDVYLRQRILALGVEILKSIFVFMRSVKDVGTEIWKRRLTTATSYGLGRAIISNLNRWHLLCKSCIGFTKDTRSIGFSMEEFLILSGFENDRRLFGRQDCAAVEDIEDSDL